MLQVRLREGNKSWFNPARDMVNMWPMLLKKTLVSFDDFAGVEGCSRDQMCQFASGYGKLVAKIIKEPVDHVMAQDDLKKLEADCPACAELVAHKAFHVLTGVFAAWVADAKPKTAGDAELPVLGLNEIAETLARGSTVTDKSK